MLSKSKKNFIPFLMAGYPNLEASERLICALLETGVSTIEIGIPFSDPLADGPMIQKASAIALNEGTTLHGVLQLVKRVKEKFPKAAIILFTYLNPILKYGLQNYTANAVSAGATATLAVDLPPEESAEYCSLHQKMGLKTIFLTSPTTSSDRISLIAERSTGFIYHVSRLGVTGAKSDVSNSLGAEIRRIRSLTEKAIAIGFGISSVAQAMEAAKFSEAVVVGSHLLSLIDQGYSLSESERQLRGFASNTLAALERNI